MRNEALLMATPSDTTTTYAEWVFRLAPWAGMAVSYFLGQRDKKGLDSAQLTKVVSDVQSHADTLKEHTKALQDHAAILSGMVSMQADIRSLVDWSNRVSGAWDVEGPKR